ncbi:MAG: SPOR domain-containing protein [Sphingomonadaceae bacterium]|nr:SPOR domain-containing protein [Sphingomonadaceae bacterium]
MNNLRRAQVAAFGAALSALTLAGLPAPAWADVRAGVEAWQAGDYARALREWRPAAVAGDADAQFNLGQAYKLGRGVNADLGQAADWFRRAAAQGHLQAEDNLGLVLYELNRKVESLPFLERSAARGEPRAQYVLGAELFNGENVARDLPRAYALMKRASDAGLQRASAALVQMDAAIPLEMRQQGLQMASAMEVSEAQARITAMTGGNAPVSAGPRQTNVRTANMPVSTPGVSYTPPPMGADPAATPPPIAAPTPAPVRATPAPATNAPVRTASGNWRIQLGAFSTRANATSLWNRLAPRLHGASAFYVNAANVVRLQAGPYASRAAADAACASIRPNACFATSAR